MANDLHKYTVQESTNIVACPRLIDVDCTTTATDHDINDVIFNWTEVSNIARSKGDAIELISASALLPGGMGDMEQREFFLREFKRQLEKGNSALKRGPYIVQGFKEMR